MRPKLTQVLLRTTVWTMGLVGAAGILSGCGGSTSGGGTTTPTPPVGSYSGLTFGGKAMVGSAPLIGASVQLYTAGTTGDGAGNSALLTTALTTDSTGAFTIAAGYTCPLPTAQVYVVARGGGVSASAANASIVLMNAVGTCNQIVASSQIVVNEVTTVAAAYALSQFLAAGANVGASSTNATGLLNAFATAGALANKATGASPGASFAANGASPAAKVDSLANLLNACTAGTAAGSGCTSLFTATTPAGGSAPANTLDAALSLARNPGLNTASVYALAGRVRRSRRCWRRRRRTGRSSSTTPAAG